MFEDRKSHATLTALTSVELLLLLFRFDFFMEKPASQINTYQLAGMDDRERGFNRQVKVSASKGVSRAVIQYEALRMEGPPGETEETALGHLIQMLQQRGYTQLRTQLIFRGDRYLGSQELWREYPDPDPSADSSEGPFRWIRRWFKLNKK